jgi:hypothetical protein
MNDNLPSYYEENSAKSDDWNSKGTIKGEKVSVEGAL